jgi:hypothetical protein
MQVTEKRSDSDILLKELKLKFGDKEYTVPVLRMKQAAKWREDYFARTKEVTDDMKVDEKVENLSKAVSRGLMAALLKFPEKIPDLVFSYSAELSEKREEILDEAYDQDFQRAFQQIWQVAFQPFLASLGMVLEMQKSQASASLSSASSN